MKNSFERGPERIPTREEVMEIINRFSSNTTVVREKSDSSGIVRRIDWVNSQITLSANTNNYLFINENSVLSSSGTFIKPGPFISAPDGDLVGPSNAVNNLSFNGIVVSANPPFSNESDGASGRDASTSDDFASGIESSISCAITATSRVIYLYY